MATSVDQPTEKRSPLAGVAAVVVMLLFVVAAAAGAWYLWHGIGDTAIGTRGLVALLIGATITILLGAGLTTLLIISSRRGYDEEAGYDQTRHD